VGISVGLEVGEPGIVVGASVGALVGLEVGKLDGVNVGLP